MRKRIAITALAALFAAGSLLGALAKPALADDHVHHHHAYQNNRNHPGWNNGQRTGLNNGQRTAGNGSWVNGKYYPNGYTGATNGNGNRWTGNRNRGNDRDRDDRNRRHDQHRDADHRR